MDRDPGRWVPGGAAARMRPGLEVPTWKGAFLPRQWGLWCHQGRPSTGLNFMSLSRQGSKQSPGARGAVGETGGVGSLARSEPQVTFGWMRPGPSVFAEGVSGHRGADPQPGVGL